MNDPRPAAKLKLENCVIFNDTKRFASKAMRKKHMYSFHFANKAFNMYIPESHHKMSVLDMKKSNGYHWASSAQFLLSSKAHGFPMWKQLQEQINSENEDISCYLHMSRAVRKKIFKGINNVASEYTDQTYDEFLLDDWVLIQLPFQPPLLHRWLTAVLLKLHNFEEIFMTPLYVYPTPPRNIYYKLHVLHEMLFLAHHSAALLFDFLQVQTEDDKEIYVDADVETFSILVSKIVDFVKFVQDEDKLRVLRLMADEVLADWDPANYRGPFLGLKRLELKRRCYMHNMSFWFQPPGNLKLFGLSNESLKKNSVVYDDSILADIKSTNLGRTIWEVIVKDEFKPIDMKVFEGDLDHLEKIMMDLNYNSGVERSLYSIRKWYRGLLTTTLHCAVSVRCSKNFQQILKYLCTVLKKPHFELYTLPRSCNVVETELAEALIGSLIVEQSNWSFGTSLRRLKMEVGEPNKTCPSVAEDPRRIALHFEARIKKIVLDTIAAHHRMTNFDRDKDVMLRDWQTAQYLLPCFVVSYLDLCESEVQATEAQKLWYLRFIHELISTYEVYKVSKSSKENIHNDCARNPNLLESITEDGEDTLLHEIEDITESFLKILDGKHDAFVHLRERSLNFGVFYEVLYNKNNPNRPSDLARKPCLYWNWLIWDFFNRMRSAMKMSKVYEPKNISRAER